MHGTSEWRVHPGLDHLPVGVHSLRETLDGAAAGEMALQRPHEPGVDDALHQINPHESGAMIEPGPGMISIYTSSSAASTGCSGPEALGLLMQRVGDCLPVLFSAVDLDILEDQGL